MLTLRLIHLAGNLTRKEFDLLTDARTFLLDFLGNLLPQFAHFDFNLSELLSLTLLCGLGRL
jgi:hypothetical protein